MKLACLVRSFPRLSQTFVLDELLALERLGAELRVFTLADSGETLVHDHVGRLKAPVVRLDPAPLSLRHVGRAGMAVLRERSHELGYHAASRWRCVGQAADLAQHLDQWQPDHLHAHFAHDPALVASVAHRLDGVPFSFTAHARDVRQVRPGALVRRAAAARFVVACCAANAAVLEPFAPGKVALVPHGVDLATFCPPADDRRPGNPPVVLSVARLVEKKGLADLLAALGRVRLPFHARIVGDGPLRSHLEAAAAGLGVAGRVTFVGPLTRGRLLAEYARASVFALTPVVTAGGDVDGIPNVVLEAMACGLPVVSTGAGGVPEAITHERDGLLAPPGDHAAIAEHLSALLDDPALRTELGRRARRTVEQRFDSRAAAQRLFDLFATTTAMWPSRPSRTRSVARLAHGPSGPAETRS